MSGSFSRSLGRLMEAALQVEGYPQELRGLWEAVKANREPGQAAWAAYNSACNQYFMQVGATRPGGFTDDRASGTGVGADAFVSSGAVDCGAGDGAPGWVGGAADAVAGHGIRGRGSVRR